MRRVAAHPRSMDAMSSRSLPWTAGYVPERRGSPGAMNSESFRHLVAGSRSFYESGFPAYQRPETGG